MARLRSSISRSAHFFTHFLIWQIRPRSAGVRLGHLRHLHARRQEDVARVRAGPPHERRGQRGMLHLPLRLYLFLLTRARGLTCLGNFQFHGRRNFAFVQFACVLSFIACRELMYPSKLFGYAQLSRLSFAACREPLPSTHRGEQTRLSPP